MKIVYIAEKPDIATAMAAYLWDDYRACKMNHAYTKHCGTDDIIITWAYGHIMMTAMPEAYGEEFADFSTYPVLPDVWKKLPSPSAKEQFEYIRNVLKTTDVVVNGGDPDREGQLLIDEILEYVGYKGAVKRILINAKDNNSLKRAFDGIVGNEQFLPLYHAGLARERADWLVGMNLSRAYTVNAKKNGSGNVWRIGRVKVPTLALVVQREREIANFTPITYYVLEGRYQKKGVGFKATLVPDEDAPTDSEGRITDKEYIDRVYKEVKSRPTRVVKCERKSQTENPPLPYSLDTLQIEANRRFGMSPSLVLEKVQSLYEKRLVSYPRSDCNYIPTSQHSDAPRILHALGDAGFATASGANATMKGRCFNDSRVSAHHALIPTGVKPAGIDSNEQTLYQLIATRYIVQFYGPCVYDTVSYELVSEDYRFAGNGRCITEPGWRAAVKEESEGTEQSVTIPPIVEGDVFDAPIYIVDEKKTTPPKRFTEGTLLAAMTNIWRFVSKDNPNKELLKECKGLGTPATRDSIISDLLASKSGKASISPCLLKKGKELVPTSFGMSMIDCIHESLTKPDMTAEMEYHLSAIAEGKMSLDDFMEITRQMVLENIKFAESSAERLSSTSVKQSEEQEIPNCECPVCHQTTLARKYSAKTKKYFWVCQDANCKHPFTLKPVFYDEYRKKPLVKVCPQCGVPLKHIYSSKTKEYYWFCEKCQEFKIMSK